VAKIKWGFLIVLRLKTTLAKNPTKLNFNFASRYSPTPCVNSAETEVQLKYEAIFKNTLKRA